MGCSCNDDFHNSGKNITQLKIDYQKEYHSYLEFLYKLKGLLNTSQLEEKNNNEENNINNTITKKEFYLIPSKWFEDWEMWVKNIIMKNEFKTFNTKFKYKNFKNKEKFFFQLINEENWKKIYKNKLYNFSEEFKTKAGIICNNLIILKYGSKEGEKNDIEILFFENDDDLFLTNLLFSFEKCENSNSECNNLLSILKSSPIYEILGNMHYDKSNSEFIEQKKKIIIYNKTRIVNDDIKKNKKNQYEIFLNPHSNNINIELEKEKEKEKENKINNEISLENKIEQNSKYIKINLIKNESQEISRASTIMNNNINNLVSNSVNCGFKIKIKKQKDIFTDEIQDGEITDEGKNSKNIDKLLLNNKLKSYSKKIKIEGKEIFNNNLNELEITEIADIKINENLLFSITFCIFTINKLREFIQKKKNIQIEDDVGFTIFLNIMNFLFDKLCTKNNSFDINKIKDINYNLIRNCPEYNYLKLVEIIRDQPGKNIISKIINLLHNSINNKIQNYFLTKNFYINKSEQNQKYTDFINNILPLNNSIFFDLFFGIKKISKICDNCKNELNSYKLMNVINISIDKIRNQQKKNKTEASEISIEECLNISLKKESVFKHMFKCPSCNNNTSCKKIKDIYVYPDIVVFYIFYDNQENIKINFNKSITLLNEKYVLIGIICSKIYLNEKIFISYCQDINDNKWFKFEEENITEIDMNTEKDDISYPESLFYQKIK